PVDCSRGGVGGENACGAIAQTRAGLRVRARDCRKDDALRRADGENAMVPKFWQAPGDFAITQSDGSEDLAPIPSDNEIVGKANGCGKLCVGAELYRGIPEKAPIHG